MEPKSVVPSGGDDGHRDGPLGHALLQGAGERQGPHALVAVHGYGDHGVRAEAQEFGGLLDAEVAALGGEDPQPGEVFGPDLRLLPRQQQGLEVRLGAAAGEGAVGGRAEPDPLGGPVDQPPLDEGAARALVPGVQGGVDGGEHGLSEHGGDDDRAVEVAQVAGVVEVDGVTEVDLAELVEGRGGVAERPVEVDRVDDGGELVHTDAAVGALGGGEGGRDPFHSRGDGGPIVLRGRVVEQVRTHGGGPPGEGNFIAPSGQKRGERGRDA